MERKTTGSRLPKPNIPRAFTPWRGQKTVVKKRPLISAPTGPILHNGNILSGPQSSTLTGPKSAPSLKTTYPTIHPDHAECQKENITPDVPSTQEGTRAKLTKSRTFNVLSSITQSISRASLTSSRTASRNFSAASRASSATSNATKKHGASPQSMESQAPSPPPANPRFVSKAQPLPYWTGRFIALHDRFHNELLSPSNLRTLMDAHAEGAMRDKPSRPPRPGPHTRLPPSATSAAIMQHSPVKDRTMARQDAELLIDDDIRCRRIFIHLEAMCLTDEARQSLYLWQQTYTTETGREDLLPLAGRLEHRSSLMGKIFNSKTRGNKRSSFV